VRTSAVINPDNRFVGTRTNKKEKEEKKEGKEERKEKKREQKRERERTPVSLHPGILF